MDDDWAFPHDYGNLHVGQVSHSLGYAPNGELYRETRDLSLSLDLEVTIFSDKPMKYT